VGFENPISIPDNQCSFNPDEALETADYVSQLGYTFARMSQSFKIKRITEAFVGRCKCKYPAVI
jgi:hypothetical protein